MTAAAAITDTIEAGRMTRARSHLLMDKPWFGTLALRLALVENDKQPTMQTNGTTLEYSPAWTATLTDAELMGVIAHEVMHCAMLHPFRTNGRDLGEWNEATDLSINPQLRASGLTLPPGKLDAEESKYVGMPAEQIFAIRHAEKQDDNGKPGGSSKPDPNATTFVPSPGKGTGDDDGTDGTDQPGTEPGDEQGTGQPKPSDAPQPMTETDWQILAEQAASAARKAGKMPGDIAREIKQTRNSELDWKTVLRRFMEQTVPSDYSWTTPNRRYIAAGLYLPGTVKENMPRLAVAIDTSGSIGQDMLDTFAAELTAIMHESRPVAIDVVYCDSAVRGTETFSPDDPEIKLTALGGGGTRFQPVIDWVEEQDEQPAALIYCTDLLGPAPTEPGIPVLWLTPDSTRAEGFFGETVRIPPSN